ncbi:sensor histidine kinase [Streptomyces sp. NRRL B-1677]|uniref:Oxygen sensor histidine kinase NreB n=1 Tax=Streptomyces klenkii TaxID=1420899 RepID=A0A3B0BCT8_9ACTN|nr:MULTISPECIES: histidine kinase [Streptomyces]MBF6044069.1 sensor histidine kinase [Streptomyces sp. NRRL B-1677]RKN70482.1 sensor histidine kinase [Streptomyces klenkii]
MFRRIRFRSPWAVDALIAAAVQAAVTIPFVVPRAADVPPATWAFYAMTTLSVLPLLWRSRAPLTCLLAITLAGFAYLPMDGPGQPMPYSPLVAIFTVAAQGGARQRWVTIVAGLPLVAVAVALRTNTAREYLFAFFLFTMVYVLGVLARTRQAYTQAVEARADALERAREQEAERAAERERARIAREMHDVLSHAVSLMIVQAEAGPLVVRSDPDRAEAAFDAIAGAGRDAMVQLRRMLGVLKEGEPGESPEASGNTGPRRTPQPTLAGLHDLVEQVRRAGIPVALLTEGEPRRLAADAQVTVYRVVQEALTNVLKHSDARAVTVRLAWGRAGGDRLSVTVADDGSGVRKPGGEGSGRGLIGIRERAAAHGGTATAGAGPDGRGYRVCLELPLVVSSPSGTADAAETVETGER